jgi:exodeoxyribonuclease III
MWLSPALAGEVADIRIAKEARGWEAPSDHVPVTATLNV